MARWPSPIRCFDRLVGAAAIVDADDVEAGVGVGDEENDRIARIAQRPDAVELAMGGRIDEDAVDLTRAEDVERGDLLVEHVVARREHETVAARRQLALDRAGGERQRRVHDVGEDQADGLGLAADQRLGDVIGEIVQLARRGEDEIAGFLRDAPALAERQRHRIRREAGGQRDILEADVTSRHFAASSGSALSGTPSRLAMQAPFGPCLAVPCRRRRPLTNFRLDPYSFNCCTAVFIFEQSLFRPKPQAGRRNAAGEEAGWQCVGAGSLRSWR